MKPKVKPKTPNNSVKDNEIVPETQNMWMKLTHKKLLLYVLHGYI